MGYLGYDVIREVERLPERAPRRPPRARRGDEHHRLARRVRPLAPARHADRERAGARPRRRRPSTAPTTPPIASIERAVANLARPLPYVPVEPPEAGEALPGRQELDARRHVPAGRRGRQGAHRRRRHLPGRARPALRPAARRRPVRRVPGAAPGQPEPVHVLPAPPRADDRRVVARADGAAARRHRDLAADRRHPQARRDRRARPPHGRRADRAPEGARRARDARRPRPQRRRPRRRVRHRARRRADDAGALQPRDAPDVAGLGRAARRASARSTCCGRRCRPARSAGRRRCGRWRSSTTSSR